MTYQKLYLYFLKQSLARPFLMKMVSPVRSSYSTRALKPPYFPFFRELYMHKRKQKQMYHRTSNICTYHALSPICFYSPPGSIQAPQKHVFFPYPV